MQTIEQHTGYDAVPFGIAALMFLYPLSVVGLMLAYVQ